jgi:hypothetical protein
MLVATFGPASAWQGREIIWETDHFVLVGHGAIPAAGLLDYDRRGQLIWADPTFRGWAYQVDLYENGGKSSLGTTGVGAGAAGAAPAGAQAAGVQAAPAQTRWAGIPAWVVVLIVVTIIAFIAAIVLAIAIPRFVTNTAQTLGQDMIVRGNAYTIQTGIDAYAKDHGGQFPAPGEVNAVGLSLYISAWPQNPYTRQPMADGGGEGNFRYDLSPDGGAYKLLGYGSGGKLIIELGGGDQTTV